MSDNLTRNCAIINALLGLRPIRPAANLARHLLTTAHLVGGIVGSKHCRLPAIASKTPDCRKLQSRVMRFRR